MKKHLLSLLAALLVVFNAGAWEYETPEFEWSVGTDVVTSYLWRGANLGGFALQPDLTIGWGGLEAELWFNISPADWSFSEMAPELDFLFSYSIAGLKVGFNHQYYFEKGEKFFDFHRMTAEQYDSEDAKEGYNFNQTEVFAEYNFGEIFEDVPLTLGWYTYVAGDDAYIDDEGKLKQAFSTYISLTYDWEALEGFTVSPTLAVTPWRSTYNYYEGKFSVANLGIKLNWEKELTDNFSFNVWAEGTMRPFQMNKDNLFISPNNTLGLNHEDQRLNGAIGVGFYFY